ncbi:protein Daple [Daktulosphaira vitifoliae]|uniref:protein Daple n=1 Tax=Daktulosphaira vitifoliae TaxID=58002 RepID=UPI0021AA7C0F|nr:protein Daple [Daktulosphaira vitifoliae]
MDLTLTEKEEFMQEHLVVWLKSCLMQPDKLNTYEDLIDGTVIYEVLLLIDPEPLYHGVIPGQHDPAIRVQNFSYILKNIKMLYEEELDQVILTMPDCLRFGREPYSKRSYEDLKLLLLLLLGCAVQCPNKEKFIERIKMLPIESQHALVHYIKQITESQKIVITQENAEHLTTDLMISHIRQLVKERDQYLQLWTEMEEKRCSSFKPMQSSTSVGPSSDNQNYAIELADWKAKLRKLRHELEEKTEALSETKEELEQTNYTVSKLKEEIEQIKVDARAAKAYRDEVDALREKAENYEHLETEIKKYKEKLSDLDYYKLREEELTQNNLLLQETRETLEEQLLKFRKRITQMQDMESQLLGFKQTINTMTLERDAHLRKIDELINENAQLDLMNKSHQFNESFNKGNIDNSFFDNIESKDNSLCEQLSSSAQSQALKLELENKKLISTIESLQENLRHQNNEVILELEKDKKLLSLQLEESENIKKRLQNHCALVENELCTLKNELKKLNECCVHQKYQIIEKSKELEITKKEIEVLKKQAEENSVLYSNEKSDLLKNVELKNNHLERDISKLKTLLENKLETIDNLSSEIELLKKENKLLITNIEENDKQITRLRDIENEFYDLESKYAVEVAATKAVQDDLVTEKRQSQLIIENLDRLGLALDQSAEPENVLDQIVSSPEVIKAVRNKINTSKSSDLNNDHVAQLEVELTTLKSKVQSLNTQHTALQLANSQLVAEKEDTQKDLDATKIAFSKLQKLHNQLAVEYEEQLKQKDSLKSDLKDARLALKEKLTQLRSVESKLKRDNEQLKIEIATVKHLPAEHSKLKDDFRALFTINEKLKTDLRNSYETIDQVEGYLKEINNLKSKLTDANARYTVLQQMTSTFVEDRRSLMEHVTMLITQYHELLTQSLEDKEQYHLEEKNNADKLNHLSRQKEKLEEKIMDHYRKLNSCSINKKKTFGSALLKRVKKAGTELINKSRTSWHEDMVRRGIDSDTSLDFEDTPLNHEYSDNLTSLGTPGTRQTLYLSGEENDCDEGSIVASHSLPDSPLTSSYQNENKLIHSINDETINKDNKSNQSVRSNKSHTNEDSNWYEYGCV